MSITLQLVPKMLVPVTTSWVPHAYVISFKLETDENLLVQKARKALDTYKHKVSIPVIFCSLLCYFFHYFSFWKKNFESPVFILVVSYSISSVLDYLPCWKKKKDFLKGRCLNFFRTLQKKMKYVRSSDEMYFCSICNMSFWFLLKEELENIFLLKWRANRKPVFFPLQKQVFTKHTMYKIHFNLAQLNKNILICFQCTSH